MGIFDVERIEVLTFKLISLKIFFWFVWVFLLVVCFACYFWFATLYVIEPFVCLFYMFVWFVNVIYVWFNCCLFCLCGLVFSSSELKSFKWAFLHASYSVDPPDCKLYHFHLLQNHVVFNQFHRKHPRVKGVQVCSNEGPQPFPRGENSKIVKMH